MRRRCAPSLVLLLAAVLAAVLTGCTTGGADRPAAAGAGSLQRPSPTPSPAVTPVAGALGPAFFGMHDSDPTGVSWPKAPVGSLRIWDSGAVWRQVETAPGRYDFRRLDALVAAARAHRAAPLIVLGQTPAFYARQPKKVGAYGPGAATMPRLAAWTAYVRAVVQRYNAPGVAFQVWNEANVENYWSGTYRQMARLTAAAREVVDSVDPRPTLVAPAMATRTLGQRAGLRLLYGEKVRGVAMADLVDVISLQLYPENGQGLQRKAALLVEARRILGLQGVPADKPVWDTEVNFGLQGGAPATPATPEQQMTNVAMTYLLDAADRVGRVYWYAWDLRTIADTELVAADGATPTAAGRAFGVVRRWLLGSRADRCRPAGRRPGRQSSPAGEVWVCDLATPRGPAWVYWSPGGAASVRTPFGATSAEPLGRPAAALPPGGATLAVGTLPVLVSSAPLGPAPHPPPR